MQAAATHRTVRAHHGCTVHNKAPTVHGRRVRGECRVVCHYLWSVLKVCPATIFGAVVAERALDDTPHVAHIDKQPATATPGSVSAVITTRAHW